MMKKVINTLRKVFHPVITACAAIAVVFVVGTVLMTVVDIFSRRLFNIGMPGTVELSGLFMVVITFFGIAYCNMEKGHIAVDLLTTQFPKIVQNILSLVMNSVAFITSVFLTFHLFIFAQNQLHRQIVSGLLEIPVYPFAYLAALSILLASVTYFIETLESLEPFLPKR